MFTGIVERIGDVRDVRPQATGRRLAIAAAGFWDALADGASVAVDGVCLTLTARRGDVAEFDVIHETLRRSTLGELSPGGRVNLERSLAVGGRLDGHIVQGHVDAIATVRRIDRSGGEARWTFELSPEVLRFVIPKGGVAIDGVSLTVTHVGRDEFGTALIPTTLERTTLGTKPVGARVNIETDIIARAVVHTLESLVGRTTGAAHDAAASSGLTIDRLKSLGFA